MRVFLAPLVALAAASAFGGTDYAAVSRPSLPEDAPPAEVLVPNGIARFSFPISEPDGGQGSLEVYYLSEEYSSGVGIPSPQTVFEGEQRPGSWLIQYNPAEGSSFDLTMDLDFEPVSADSEFQLPLDEILPVGDAVDDSRGTAPSRGIRCESLYRITICQVVTNDGHVILWIQWDRETLFRTPRFPIDWYRTAATGQGMESFLDEVMPADRFPILRETVDGLILQEQRRK